MESRSPFSLHVGEGSSDHGQSESHGGGGPFALPNAAEDPPQPSRALDEKLSNLVTMLSTHNLIKLAANCPH